MDILSARTERFKHGKALRHKTPREAHADLKGSLTRDAVAILAESDRDRVPELVPERYARMTQNAFRFLRGAAAVMATDLAGEPAAGIPVQGGGDSHLMNFGAFVTPEDNILFDVNDFDETLPGVDFHCRPKASRCKRRSGGAWCQRAQETSSGAGVGNRQSLSVAHGRAGQDVAVGDLA